MGRKIDMTEISEMVAWQVGTSFAFTKESGLVPSVKQFVLRKVNPPFTALC